MNILILGAASKTGKKLIANALRRGHIVTVLSDNPSKIQMFDDHLRIVKGSCCVAEDLNSALNGQNAVISVIASERRLPLPLPQKKIIKNIDTILPMMNGHMIRRFIAVDTTTPFRRKIDKKPHIQSIKNSALDWTIVKPAKLIDKPKTYAYKAGEDVSANIFSKVSHGDVADYVIGNIENGQLIGKVITIRH